jgi:hypothetical protein
MSHEPWQVSKRLVEVWEWKDAIAQKVAHLPIDEALTEILRKSAEANKDTPFPRVDPRIPFNRGEREKVS